MGKRYELTGQIFGRLTVIDFDHISSDGASYWLCECGCSNRTRLVVKGYDLKRGHTLSCGCMRKEAYDITGQIFGRLTVLGLDHITESGRTYWLCECNCSDRSRVVVRRDGLVSGATLSCGCLHREQVTERLTRHGMARSRLYKIWLGMRQRCENENNPGYAGYGGRGVAISDEWDCFEKFCDWSLSHGYSDDLTIDRIDNDIGYSPENCRWTDRITQQNNRRVSHYFTYAGETMTITQWSRRLGVSYSTLWYRIERGDFRDFEDYFSNKEQDT